MSLMFRTLLVRAPVGLPGVRGSLFKSSIISLLVGLVRAHVQH